MKNIAKVLFFMLAMSICTYYAEAGTIRGFKAVACGFENTIALKDDGTVLRYGVGVPQKIAGLTDIIDICASHDFELALKKDGSVWIWSYQISDFYGIKLDYNPTKIQGYENIKSIFCGYDCFFALKSDGTLLGLGKGFNGDTKIGNVKSVACGMCHVAILKDDGTVWTFGQDYHGSLGLGNDISQVSSPTKVLGLPKIEIIAVSNYNTYAVDFEGNLWGWGENGSYQLGDISSLQNYSPVKINGVSDIAGVFAAPYNVILLRNNGDVWGIGNNSCGVFGLGDNYTNYLRTPQKLPFKDITKISCEEFHASYITVTGELYSSGWNSHGMLGINSSISKSTIPVEPVDDVPPSIPTDVHIVAQNSNNIISWSESKDLITSVTYIVYKNGNELGRTKNLNYTDKNANNKENTKYYVKAMDEYSNTSAMSNLVSAGDESIIYGDISGDGIVDSADYTFLRQYLLEIISELPSKDWRVSCDLNGDKSIDSADFTILRKFLIGTINKFPVETSYYF